MFLKRLIFGLAALLVLALLAAVLLLTTTTGSRWLLAQVPGLQVQGFDGRLLGFWRAQRLSWQENGQRVVLSDVQMTINAGCLLRLTLCVEQLQGGRLDLHLPPADTDKGDTAPLKLPSIGLPLIALELTQVQLGRLYLDADELLGSLNLQAKWRGYQVVIEHASARQQGRLITLSGELQMQQDWPLNAAAQLALPAPGGEDWQLKLTASGNLLETLAIQGQSQGWLNAQLSAAAKPLAQHLPLNLELDSEQPPLFGLPDNLQLNQVRITGSGDLQAGYQLQARANLPNTAANQPPLSIHLQALAFAQQIEIKQLQLAATDTQSLTATGVIRWQPDLTAQLNVHGQDFPWQRLYPLEPLPLALTQINAKVQYANGQYQGDFRAALGGTGTDLSLSSPFQGDLTQLVLGDLQLKTDAGGAQGKLNLKFAGALTWQLALTLQQLNPAFWLDELPGQLSGSLNTQGKLQGATVQGDFAVDLNGTLRRQAAYLLAEGQGSGQGWNLNRLKVQLGDNHLYGNASSAGEQLQAGLTLRLPQLKQLWPELSGSANGRVRLYGTRLKPQGTLQLAAQKIVLAEQSIGKLNIDGKFLEDNGTLQVFATDMEASGQRFSRLTLNASQKGTAQQLRGELNGEWLKADFALNGQYQVLKQGWQWLGDLQRLELAGYGQHWQLSTPAHLERQANGRLSLAAHCLQSAKASLCADNLKLLPQVRLNYRLQGFELASLDAWLADNLRLAGQLAGEATLDTSAGLNGSLHLTSEGGTLRVQQQDQWLDLPWQRFSLNGQMDKTAIGAALDFQSKVLGGLSGKLQLNPNRADKPIHGQWQLDGLDLALMLPFLPQLSDLGGQLSGQGQLQGGLLAPQIEADMALKQGQIRSPDLPLQLHQLELSARVRGEQMQLSGGFASGEAGRGELNGQLSWQQGLSGALQIKGEQLPVSLPPYAELQVFPDVTLHLAEDKLSIDGSVKVPSGAIEIHSLPPSVVRPSIDAVVVGREVKSSAEHNIGMAIALEVGSERVSFNGFGLQAELVGALHIGDNLSTQGELNLRGGRYRSYGQNLKVRRARLLFTGSLQQPFVDIEAVREVDSVVAGLRISGSADRPQTRIFAEPSMSDEQALSYLVLGKPLGSDSGGSNDLLLKAALGLGLSGGEALAERFGEQMGLSHFELGTQGSGENTQVVVSGTLANRLSLSYGVGLFEPQGTLALRYQLTRRLYLEAASSLANSLDLLYRRDF